MNPCRRFAHSPDTLFRAIAAAIAGALVALMSPATTLGDLSTEANYLAARSALADGLPQVAVAKLDQLLTAPAVGALDASEKAIVERLRLEALVRAGDYSTALTSATGMDAPDPGMQFWIALAEAGSGSISSAAERLALLEAATNFDYLDESRLIRAQLLHQLGDDEAALRLLESMIEPISSKANEALAAKARLAVARLQLVAGDTDAAEAQLTGARTPAIDYLSAWIAVEKNDAEAALAGFVALLATPPASQSRVIHDGARFGLGRAHLLAGNAAAARDEFIALLDTSPDSLLAAAAMRQLTMSPLDSDPAISRKIDQWRSDDEISLYRQGLAMYYHAIEQLSKGAKRAARDELEDFLDEHPDHPLEVEARLHLAERLLDDGDIDDARELITEIEILSAHPAILDRVDYLRGLADFEEGDLASAIDGFRKATRLETERKSRDSTFNVALARLHADTEVSVDSILDQQAETLGLADSRAELLLERGLYLARQGNGAAFEVLGEFVRRFNDHRHAADAELALSELHLNQIPPKPVSAREHIQSAKSRELTIDQREQLDHVSIWVEESAGEDRKVIELAHRFLDQWRLSRLRPSVLMKLGETYYRLGEFSPASEIFARLTQEAPNSAYAPAAQFFAAKAASLSVDPEEQEHAIELWREVVAGSGTFAAAALHEEGLLHIKLDDIDEAIESFQALLDLQPPPPADLRFAALCDIGQAWFSKSSAEVTADADFAPAIAAFDQVLGDEAVTLAWKAQAAVRKAKCLEVLGQITEALTLYHDTLDEQDQPPMTAGSLEAQDWYYRAGFAAIRLLEREKQWPAAVAIATRLGRRGGPRSVEAEDLADRLRLEHFIWDK